MSFVLLTNLALIVVCQDFISSICQAQEIGTTTFPSVQENRTVRNEQQPLSVMNKKNDWWPPNIPAPLEPEVAQSYQYSPWIQPPISANYYLPGGPFSPTMGQVRSEHYVYPSEYPEYSHAAPLVAQSSGNSLGIGPKHLAIVSFIGLLLLFAIIQNSLMSAKRKDALVDALTGRKKRDLLVGHGLRAMSEEQEEILNDDARLRCIQRTICLENRRLMENFGFSGRKLAKYLTNGVKKSVGQSSGWDRLVEDAAQVGLKGENCDVLYRDCTITPLASTFHRNIDGEMKFNGKHGTQPPGTDE